MIVCVGIVVKKLQNPTQPQIAQEFAEVVLEKIRIPKFLASISQGKHLSLTVPSAEYVALSKIGEKVLVNLSSQEIDAAYDSPSQEKYEGVEEYGKAPDPQVKRDIFEEAMRAVKKINRNEVPTWDEITALKMTVQLVTASKAALKKLYDFIRETLPDLPTNGHDDQVKLLDSNIYSDDLEKELIHAFGKEATLGDVYEGYVALYQNYNEYGKTVSKADLAWLRKVYRGFIYLKGELREEIKNVHPNNLKSRTGNPKDK
ncbi:MAG: hypothetical protein NTW98_01140 [Candidatus Nomurabacteria bacterium]|nr:hypothetical protein [Candidatus Nomurabacteria bacterium]